MKINGSGESEKTIPIQTQSNPIAERVKLMQSVYLQWIMKKNTAKGYVKTKPKQTQFPKCQKMNANAFSQKDYEKETAFRPKKTNPNKPNFKRRTYSLTGQSGFINMVSGKIIDNSAEVTGAWWCPWSSKPVWG